jgi:predicted esterase
MRFICGVGSGLLVCVFVYVCATAAPIAAPQLGAKLTSLMQPSRARATQDEADITTKQLLLPMVQTVTAPSTFITRTRRILRPIQKTQRREYDYSPSLAAKTASQPGTTGAITWQSYLPEGDTAAPLILLFAGTGRPPESMIDMWLGTARGNDQALLALDTRDVDGFFDALNSHALHEIIAEIGQTRAIDPEQIYLFGHSQGGQVALTLANQIKGPWRAVATHAGHPPASAIRDAQDAPPLRLYLGEQDHIFSVPAAKEVGKRYATAGHRTELHLIPDHTHWFYDIGPKIAADAWKWFQAIHEQDQAGQVSG